MELLPEGLLDENQAAGAVRCKTQKLRKLVRQGEGPPHISIGRFRYYRPEALRQWLLGRERASEPPPEPRRGRPPKIRSQREA
jgi:hypothetical protein